MDKFEHLLSQIVDSIRSDGNFIVENHIREGRAHDERLAQHEQLLRRLLDMVVEQRKRFSVYAEAAAEPQRDRISVDRDPRPRERLGVQPRPLTNAGDKPGTAN